MHRNPSQEGGSNKRKLAIDDFEIQGTLGEGSYGKVYCALDKSDKKLYAIKVLDKYHIMKVKFNSFLLLSIIALKSW